MNETLQQRSSPGYNYFPSQEREVLLQLWRLLNQEPPNHLQAYQLLRAWVDWDYKREA